MKQFVCNYALIRFLPYREGGEFVNIGVALTCAEQGFFAYRLETKRFARVTRFFPKLDSEIYREGLKALDSEFNRLYLESGMEGQNARFWTREISREEWTRQLFAELVRPREALFHLGPPRTIMTTQPAKTLEDLFQRYVHQQFPEQKDGLEEKLRQQMKASLEQFRLNQFYRERRIGNDEYNCNLPFVADVNNSAKKMTGSDLQGKWLKAIKPLDLNRPEPNEIYNHGDDWISKVRRLDANYRPDHWLFAIHYPTSGKKLMAARTIARELEDLGVTTLDFKDKPGIHDFAYIAETQPASILEN